MAKSGRSRKKPGHHSRGQNQEEYHLLESLNELVNVRGTDPSQTAYLLNKANELVRRAIQHVSSGVNVSNVLRQLIREVEAKKMLSPKLFYSLLWLCSTQDSETATMVAGLLQRRCSDPDEGIRAASLRMLSSLRIHNLIDTIMPTVETCLDDTSSAVVRGAAVIAVMKIADLDDDIAEASGLWDKVMAMMRADPSPDVRYQCFVVCLQKKHERELLQDQGFMREIMAGLQAYRPHQQARILALLALYKPTETPTTAFGHSAPGVPEVGAFMDAVEPCLSSIDSSTMLSAINALLQWAKSTDNEFWYSQALNRVKQPLYGLMKRSDPEIAFVALSHVKLLVQQAQYAFAEDFQQFYCRHADPAYIKIMKMGILQYLATDQNQYMLVLELLEYTKERTVEVGRAAVRALGHVVLSLSDTAGLIEGFLDLLSSGDDSIVSEVVIMVRDVLRKFPDVAAPFGPSLQQVQMSSLQSGESRAAYIWIRAHLDSLMLPEPAEAQPTPAVLEELADNWASLSHVEKDALLWAAPRVSFVRAPATVPVLRKILHAALHDSDTAVADGGRFIVRALQRGLDSAQALLAPPLQQTDLRDGRPDHLLEELMSEFNTMAVVFEKPARMFVDPKAYPHRDALQRLPSQEGELQSEGVDNADDLLLDIDAPEGEASAGASEADLAGSQHDLLADFAEPAVSAGTPPGPQLDPSAGMQKDTFQAAWSALENAHFFAVDLGPAQLQALQSAQPTTFAQLHQRLAAHHVKVFAEGGPRALLYCRLARDQQPAFLEESLQSQGSQGSVVVTIKSPDADAAAMLRRIWDEQASQYFAQL